MSVLRRARSFMSCIHELVPMALVSSLSMYSFFIFGFVNGISSFDQLYIGSGCQIPTLSLPPSLAEFSSCRRVIDSSVFLESFHTSITGWKCPWIQGTHSTHPYPI